jgi:hypothetical protein
MKMQGKDFVNVRLNELGEKLAGGSPMVLTGSKHSFTFKAGESQPVTRVLEWERVLSKEHHDGEPIFELVDGPATPKEIGSTEGEDHY